MAWPKLAPPRLGFGWRRPPPRDRIRVNERDGGGDAALVVCGLVEAMRGGGGRGRGGRCGVDPMGERSMEVGFGSGVPVAGATRVQEKKDREQGLGAERRQSHGR
jgi:hypothetical protein